MRVTVFGDIHGNLPALRAALTDMRAQSADTYVCLLASGMPHAGWLAAEWVSD